MTRNRNEVFLVRKKEGQRLLKSHLDIRHFRRLICQIVTIEIKEYEVRAR
jgi:hypothetical protein